MILKDSLQHQKKIMGHDNTWRSSQPPSEDALQSPPGTLTIHVCDCEYIYYGTYNLCISVCHLECLFFNFQFTISDFSVLQYFQLLWVNCFLITFHI